MLPVTFGALDGEAEWRDRWTRSAASDRSGRRRRLAHAALFTALRTGFADALLRGAFEACRDHRTARRRRSAPARRRSRGLGKLLVVAPDQANARRYLELLRKPCPAAQATHGARRHERCADAQEALAAFRLRPEPAILVTVAMAYEGLDAPGVSDIAA